MIAIMAIFTYEFLNLPLFIFFILITLPSASAVYFKMPRFDPNEHKILYQGDAAPSVGAIELNNRYTYACRVGWATYAERVQLWDSHTGKLSDISIQFAMTIDTQGRTSNYGNGATFFIAPAGSQIPLNSAGGFLGLFNTTTAYSSSNQIFMVEFDSTNNPEWDPSDVQGHVGINNNSIASAVYTSWNASFHSGNTADVSITYNATTKNFSVSWNYRETSNSQENTSLFYIIDLMKVLPEWVTVGFSAATGQFLERHILESWEFNSSFDGIHEKHYTTAKKHWRIIVAVTVPTSVCALILILGVLWWRKRKQKKRNPPESISLTSNNDDYGAGPRRCNYGPGVASATNNFYNYTRLGEGGFNTVYVGCLFDTAVAVQNISRGIKQGKEEYMIEVQTISQLKNQNLAQLVRSTHDTGDFLLVYEFKPSGSLCSHLFDTNSLLTWAMRYKISLSLASALLYLHEKWEQYGGVHLDITSSNIMLDSNFNVRLGDFGLSRLINHKLGPQTTEMGGASGYLAPEYVSTGNATKESDVYSFGVIVLEIATGKKSADLMEENSEVGLVEWVWNHHGKGKLLLGVDERLKKSFDKKQVECLMIVGLWCAQPDCSSRPSIKEAIQVLNFEITMPNLPTKMPVLSYDDHLPKQSMSSSQRFLTNLITQGR